MKNLLLLLVVLSASSCAQNTYRAHDGYADSGYYGRTDRYGRDPYYADADYDDIDDYDDDYYDDDYGYDRDAGYYRDSLSDVDIDFNLNLNWNAFPDRFGIAYGATINGPYRYPRVGFYYQNNWYPSAWWGSYAAFDPWYSDYYYRHRGSHLSLSFNFYDIDDDWDDAWLDAGWGYALGYNWFRPAYGWNPWRRHHRRWYSSWYDPFYDPFYDPWYGSAWTSGWGYGYSRHHRHGAGNWVIGPHFTPIYRGGYDRTDHIDTRSEAARLAARAPHYRSGYRSSGRVSGNAYSSRHSRRDNPRNVVTRQYKRPYERQRSTRSTHRYDRVPATSQPFTGQTTTTLRRHSAQRLQGSQRPVDSSARRFRQSRENGENRLHSRNRSSRSIQSNRGITARSNKPLYRPQYRVKPPTRQRPTQERQPAATTSRQRHAPQPVVRNINRYRQQPLRPQRVQPVNRYQRPATTRHRSANLGSSRSVNHQPRRAATTASRPAPQATRTRLRGGLATPRSRHVAPSHQPQATAPRAVPAHSPRTANRAQASSRKDAGSKQRRSRNSSAREQLQERRRH